MFYNTGMNLLSVQGQGAVYTVCIFFICVIIVHIAKLAIIGWRAFKKPPKKPAQDEAPEPVYYLVEKKKRTAPKYEKPKKFKFQK